MPRLLYAPLLLALLAACAPAAAPRVSVTQLTEAPTYYPHPTGAVWRYLAEGEPQNAAPLSEGVEGPTIVEGRSLVAWRTAGRGVEARTYRDYRETGVFVPRVSGPGYVTTITPPIQEWPRAGTLRVGLSWGGEATSVVRFTEADEEQTVRLEYRYEVVDFRPVTTTAGTFEVYVVAFESRSVAPSGETLEELRQELWFTPFVGEIRTETGLVLLETNLPLTNAVVPDGTVPDGVVAPEAP